METGAGSDRADGLPDASIARTRHVAYVARGRPVIRTRVLDVVAVTRPPRITSYLRAPETARHHKATHVDPTPETRTDDGALIEAARPPPPATDLA